MDEKLSRVIRGRAEYERLVRKIEELNSLATRVTSSTSLTPRGQGKPIEEIWGQLIDYKSACSFQIIAYLTDSRELEKELDCIRNSSIRTAMKYFYLDGTSIEKIAQAMNYSTRTIDRLLQTGRRIYRSYYGD